MLEFSGKDITTVFINALGGGKVMISQLRKNIKSEMKVTCKGKFMQREQYNDQNEENSLDDKFTVDLR